MAFSWNNLFQAIALYFSYKREKGKDNPDDIVVPVPVEPKPKPDPKPPVPVEPKPEPKPEPDPVDDGVWSMHYSHYNPISWAEGAYEGRGRGVSIIFCPDSPKWKSVTINGKAMRFHAVDRGREIWTNFDFRSATAETRISGTIVATDKSGKSIKIKVTGEGTYMNHRGDCFRQYA